MSQICDGEVLSMLALLGFGIIAVFLYTTMTKKLSIPVALIIIPVVFGLIGGFGTEIGKMMISGIVKVTPSAMIPIFAVIYFGLMIDAGMFDPMVNKILKLVKGDPVKITIGAAVLAMLVSLDGDGTTTFIISVTAMYPITRKINMNPLILPFAVGMAAGVMNPLPWSGPTTRVMATLQSDASVVFNPIIPAMIAGIAWVLFACYYVGKKERARLGMADLAGNVLAESNFDGVGQDLSIKRPHLFWFNVIMTVLIIAGLLAEIMPMATLFVIGFAIAITVNYPNLKDQQERMKNYSAEVVTIVTLIFSAGCFTGILSGTKMVTEMARALVSLIPQGMGSLLPLAVAITSMPLSLVFPTDAYYFGVLPVIYEMAASIGIEPVQIGRAAILGQMTVGFPLSPLAAATLVLISVAKVNLVEHQKFMFLWAFGTTIVMTIVAYLTGALTF